MIKTPIAVIGIDLGKNSFSMGGFPRVMDRLMKEMVLERFVIMITHSLRGEDSFDIRPR